MIEEVYDDDENGRAASQTIQDLKVFPAAACPVGVDCGLVFCSNRRVPDPRIFLGIRRPDTSQITYSTV